jgi:putative membrane protein
MHTVISGNSRRGMVFPACLTDQTRYTMKKNNFFVAALLLAGVSLNTACNSTPKDETKDSKEVAQEQNEQKFATDSTDNAKKNADWMVDVTATNYHEVAMASVAKEKSTNKTIRSLADSLISDHKQVIEDLKGVASKKSVTLPVAETEDAMKDTEKYKAKNNTDFNKDWVDEMVSLHEKSISKFEDAVNNTSTDGEIKTWAGATLPKLRHHLDMLKALQANLKK